MPAPPEGLTKPLASPPPALALDSTSCRPWLGIPGFSREPPQVPRCQGCTWVHPGCGWAWPCARSSPGQVNRREQVLKPASWGRSPVCLPSQPTQAVPGLRCCLHVLCVGDPKTANLPLHRGSPARACSVKGFWALLFPGLRDPCPTPCQGAGDLGGQGPT